MPHLTYSDVRTKVLKRERYKINLTQAKHIIPVFTEEDDFSKLKGQKRFIRLVKFHLALPHFSQKNPVTPVTNVMLGKIVNFVKLRLSTFTQDGQFWTIQSPYNYFRGPLLYKSPADSDFYTLKGTSESNAYLEAGSQAIPVGMLSTPVEKTPVLLETTWELNGDTGEPMIPSVTNMNSLPVDMINVSTFFNKASNYKSLTDSKIVDTLNDIPCVTYDFLSRSNFSYSTMKKVCVRPSRTSTASALSVFPGTIFNYESDPKFDTDILSEIGMKTDRVYVDLWENLKTQKPGLTYVDDVIKNPADNAGYPANSWQNGPSADIDKPLRLDKYFPFDESTGAYDTTASTYIPGRTNENGSSFAGLDQWLTILTATLEFEIILVDLSKKK